jgi:UNC-50 family
VVVYVGQFLLLPVLLGPSIGALLLSNALYALGFCVYFYVSHLGYRRYAITALVPLPTAVHVCSAAAVAA